MRTNLWMAAALALALGAVGCRNVDDDEIGGQTTDGRDWEDLADGDKDRDFQAGDVSDDVDDTNIGVRDDADRDLQSGAEGPDVGDSAHDDDFDADRDLQTGEIGPDVADEDDLGEEDDAKDLQSGKAAPATTVGSYDASRAKSATAPKSATTAKSGEMKAYVVDHADANGITLRAEGSDEKAAQSGSELYISKADYQRITGGADVPSVGEKVKASVGSDGKAAKIELIDDSTGSWDATKKMEEPAHTYPK